MSVLQSAPALLARKGSGLHPATQMVIWLCLTWLLQTAQGEMLLALSLVILGCALYFCAARLRVLLRRTRWIFISLLFIYGYATAGESVWAQWGSYSPTREGLTEGLIQLGRLVGSLAALAILLMRLSNESLIVGIYALLSPLSGFGFPHERIAVRLALTLRYAEMALLDTARDWRSSITHLLMPPIEGVQHLVLPNQPMYRLDFLLMGLSVLLGVWL